MHCPVDAIYLKQPGAAAEKQLKGAAETSCLPHFFNKSKHQLKPTAHKQLKSKHIKEVLGIHDVYTVQKMYIVQSLFGKDCAIN
jgi:hypothetical protein